MSGRIKMTPEQMRTRAKQYRTEADTVGGVISRMDALLPLLMEEWEGKASESYGNRYRELRPNFVKTETLIREIAAALDVAANSIEGTDTDIAHRFG